MPFIQGGVIPALLTPFTKGGKQVDYDKAAGLAGFLADRGVNGLFARERGRRDADDAR